jgi:hypothetical protein
MSELHEELWSLEQDARTDKTPNISTALQRDTYR